MIQSPAKFADSVKITPRIGKVKFIVQITKNSISLALRQPPQQAFLKEKNYSLMSSPKVSK